jgi:hypothetical protein
LPEAGARWSPRAGIGERPVERGQQDTDQDRRRRHNHRNRDCHAQSPNTIMLPMLPAPHVRQDNPQ